jgi:hypothetical protein
VDAIQFAFTGEIGRLKGAGTGDLTLTDHGPHVERRDDPGACSVCVRVYIPHLNKSASITRTIKKPKHPSITPDVPDVKAVFAELEGHPEISLSRREIIKFILTEATQRSRDVQTLLKLDDIDQTRALLKTAENKLNTEFTAAKTQALSAEDSLKRHLDLPALKSEDLLAAVNKRRKVLSFPDITELTKDTDLSEGLGARASAGANQQTKESTLADIKAAIDTVRDGVESPVQESAALVLEDAAKVDTNPALLVLIKRHSFIESGLGFVDGPYCPLCDSEWDMEPLRAHLRRKLEQSKEAQVIGKQLVEAGRLISGQVIRLQGIFSPLTKLPETDKEFAREITQWLGDIAGFSNSLGSLEGVLAAKERLAAGWGRVPAKLLPGLEALEEKAKARPDKSATNEATSYLIIAQERLEALRRARRGAEEKKAAAARGRTAYKLYCEVAEAALMMLYNEVEGEFGAFYRAINHDDEHEFKAQFEPAEGKLGLLVDFYKKGMFPPSAYHSEGHQDGMGLCLYLALMLRVLGDKFTIAVLDDVVMSVDSQHRKQFCKLLKTEFPNTQFIITTHDQVWAKQLRSEGVVGKKSAIAFHTWTVETGPVLDEVTEVWDKIEADLAKNDVPAAAARLRRHLEYVASELADDLGAKVSFKADAGYDMGELLSAVIGRQSELLKLAAKAAKSWDDTEQIEKVAAIQKARQDILTASNGEQWVINKAVHYNKWADLSRNDFKPVVSVFKQLLQQFRCPKSKCDSWLSITPRNDPVDLRCACGSLRFNLLPAGPKVAVISP